MSRNNKEPFSNIRPLERGDRGEITREKFTETHPGLIQVNKSLLYNPGTSDCTMNLSESSGPQEDYLKGGCKTEESQRMLNLKHLELTSWKSELNSNADEARSNLNYINFFSLPKFGIAEKSTQTMLTSRDLDDLDFFRRELQTCRAEISKSGVQGLKKLFPYLEEKKSSNGVRVDEAIVSPSDQGIKNFICIKRRNEDFIPVTEGKKSKMQHSNQNTQINNLSHHNAYPHIHIKNKRNTNSKRKRKVAECEESKETHDTKKVDFEEYDIPEFINDLKRRAGTELDQSEKSTTKSTNLGTSDIPPLSDKPFVSKPARKFDAYQFFKAEYATTHKDKSEEELEKVF